MFSLFRNKNEPDYQNIDALNYIGRYKCAIEAILKILFDDS
jgi:hypothetical protein